ncbi:hypothetical protein [Povalibacter sp.]|uniref:hypothetical protein n=1 Tax=Povalibacter sp. TaxID=1962978 RepID=UPI002F3F5308
MCFQIFFPSFNLAAQQCVGSDRQQACACWFAQPKSCAGGTTQALAMKVRTALVATALAVCCAVAYFWWHSSKLHMVSIFVTGKNGECVISESEVSYGPSMLCVKAPEYLRSTLGLTSGTRVTVAATRHVGPKELDALLASLAGDGYEVENVIKAVGFVRE